VIASSVCVCACGPAPFRFVGFWGGVCSHWRRDGWVDETGEKVPDPNPAPLGKGGSGGGRGAEHTTDFITRHAVRIVGEHGGAPVAPSASLASASRHHPAPPPPPPLFLWASYTAPHTPHEAPDALVQGCRYLKEATPKSATAHRSDCAWPGLQRGASKCIILPGTAFGTTARRR
jgi:hypothetical protein